MARDTVASASGRSSRALCFWAADPWASRAIWQPVLRICMTPFATSRMFTVRLPRELAGGISGSTSAHSSSVRSPSYRRWRGRAAALPGHPHEEVGMPARRSQPNSGSRARCELDDEARAFPNGRRKKAPACGVVEIAGPVFDNGKIPRRCRPARPGSGARRSTSRRLKRLVLDWWRSARYLRS